MLDHHRGFHWKVKSKCYFTYVYVSRKRALHTIQIKIQNYLSRLSYDIELSASSQNSSILLPYSYPFCRFEVWKKLRHYYQRRNMVSYFPFLRFSKRFLFIPLHKLYTKEHEKAGKKHVTVFQGWKVAFVLAVLLMKRSSWNWWKGRVEFVTVEREILSCAYRSVHIYFTLLT